MDNFVMRIGCITLNELLAITKEMHVSLSEALEMNEKLSQRELVFSVLEELDTTQIKKKKIALIKLLKAIVIKQDTNFLLEPSLDLCFNKELLIICFEMNLLVELSRNLAFIFTKFTELTKDLLNIAKLKLLYLIKINLLLIFLIIHFNSSNPELRYFIKNSGDDLEDNILKFLKLSTTYKFIPNSLCLLVLFSYVKILLSDNSLDEPTTCRKIEKKDKYLTKQNFYLYMQKDVPKILFKYEKDNNYIEKFYRKNIIKREKNEFDRVTIMNVLKILLNSCSLMESSPNNNINNFEENYKEILSDHLLLTSLRYQKEIFSKKENKALIDEGDSQDPLNVTEKSMTNVIQNRDDEELKVEEIMSFNKLEKSELDMLEMLNKFSICYVVIAFYFNVIKSLQVFDLIQFSYYGFLLCDFNGLLVFLKFLNQEVKNIQQYFTTLNEQNKLNLDFIEAIDNLIYVNLKLIYAICNKNEERIKTYLIGYNIPVILKRLLAFYQKKDEIRKWCLKLFKIQLKFLDKNWRMENNFIITSIYQYLKYNNDNSTLDNWLKYETKDQKNMPYQHTELYSLEELKKIYNEYNQMNYLKYLNNPEEMDKYFSSNDRNYYSSFIMKMWNSVNLTDDFKNNYEKYV